MHQLIVLVRLYTGRYVISAHHANALTQQIALLIYAFKYLKDLHCSWSLRETVQLDLKRSILGGGV